MSDAIQPFRIAVPQGVLEDLRQRLRATRFPDQLPHSGWQSGTDGDYLRDLCRYWAEDFDWRKQEARLNSFAQFHTEIDGERVHFLHVRSPRADATPLLISHGWPGSVAEFIHIIEPLVQPPDADTPAFHVVCPSLPGYGFSGATKKSGVHCAAIAEIFATLMQRLGYRRYLAQGGDWGAVITSLLGLCDADHVLGIHLNMPLAVPGNEEDKALLSAQEQQDMADMQSFESQESAYQKLQGSKPQSLGVGLNDSPAGLAAWIVEKFHGWTDCKGNPENAVSRDDLLTNITIYWVTQTICSSMRLYYETFQHPESLRFLSERVEVPTGVARYPKEMIRFPRRWVERHYNLRHWTEMPSGGHFAALEAPDSLVRDVRAFRRSLD